MPVTKVIYNVYILHSIIGVLHVVTTITIKIVDSELPVEHTCRQRQYARNPCILQPHAVSHLAECDSTCTAVQGLLG